MANRKSAEKLNICIYALFLAGYFACLCFLFYNQLSTVNDRFESDTLVHVRFAVEDHYYYSLSSYLYAFLNLFGHVNISVSIMLALITVGSVWLTYILMDRIAGVCNITVPKWFMYIGSFAMNLATGFYIRVANVRHYIGYQSGNMWHNSTYTFMRFMALITLIYYIKIADTYRQGIKFKEWLIFTLLLSVTTGFKPSFLTVFAPFLLIKLIYDWIKGTKFLNIFIMGTTVFMPIGIMALESMVLFPGDGNSGYMIAPFKALSMRGDHPKVSLVLSVLFPLCVLFFNLKNIKYDKIYSGSLIIWLVGFLEVFLLIETGDRALDSNFFWGYSISIFIVFIASLLKAYKSFKESKSRFRVPIAITESAILIWHVISGIWYFTLLLKGFTYFV